jgi:hypothetical protein
MTPFGEQNLKNNLYFLKIYKKIFNSMKIFWIVRVFNVKQKSFKFFIIHNLLRVNDVFCAYCHSSMKFERGKTPMLLMVVWDA